MTLIDTRVLPSSLTHVKQISALCSSGHKRSLPTLFLFTQVPLEPMSHRNMAPLLSQNISHWMFNTVVSQHWDPMSDSWIRCAHSRRSMPCPAERRPNAGRVEGNCRCGCKAAPGLLPWALQCIHVEGGVQAGWPAGSCCPPTTSGSLTTGRLEPAREATVHPVVAVEVDAFKFFL